MIGNVTTNNAPVTLLLSFSSPANNLIVRLNGKIYYSIIYSNFFGKKVLTAKVNLSEKGTYTLECDSNFTTSITELEPYTPIELPNPQYNKVGAVKFVYNPKCMGTPARINLSTHTIEYGDQFKNLPLYAQKFIIEHEKAHMLYKSEWFTDLYAYDKFMRKGGNKSSALTTLQVVLRRNPMNAMRLKNLIGAINS